MNGRHDSGEAERKAAAEKVMRAFDPLLFEACAHPVRLTLIRRLLELGGGRIKDIAEDFPQDRSVISRHLAHMERAGIVRSRRRGREVFYDLNGPELVRRLNELAGAAAALTRICCPSGADDEGEER